MPPSEFWGATHKEVVLYILSVNDRNRDMLKMQALFNHDLAVWIAKGIAGKTIPSLQTAYPHLYPKEPVRKQSWERDKANLLKWISATENGGLV